VAEYVGDRCAVRHTLSSQQQPWCFCKMYVIITVWCVLQGVCIAWNMLCYVCPSVGHTCRSRPFQMVVMSRADTSFENFYLVEFTWYNHIFVTTFLHPFLFNAPNEGISKDNCSTLGGRKVEFWYSRDCHQVVNTGLCPGTLLFSHLMWNSYLSRSPHWGALNRNGCRKVVTKMWFEACVCPTHYYHLEWPWATL